MYAGDAYTLDAMKPDKQFCGNEHWSGEPCKACDAIKSRNKSGVISRREAVVSAVLASNDEQVPKVKRGKMLSAPQDTHAPIDPPAASGPIAQRIERSLSGEAADSNSAGSTKPKTDRKEYLRLKAIERRAATKLGLTVQAYRSRKETL